MDLSKLVSYYDLDASSPKEELSGMIKTLSDVPISLDGWERELSRKYMRLSDLEISAKPIHILSMSQLVLADYLHESLLEKFKKWVPSPFIRLSIGGRDRKSAEAIQDTLRWADLHAGDDAHLYCSPNGPAAALFYQLGGPNDKQGYVEFLIRKARRD